MSLQTLVAKINEATESEILALKNEAKAQEQSLRAHYEEKTAQLEQDVAAQVEEKKKLLRNRTELLAATKRKVTLSQAKKLLIAHVFSEALKSLQQGEHRTKAQSVLRKKLESSEGTLEEAPDGGFMFYGKKYDIDATFPTIVERELKNALLPEVSRILFGTHST